jgi:hypothetical protein
MKAICVDALFLCIRKEWEKQENLRVADSLAEIQPVTSWIQAKSVANLFGYSFNLFQKS